MQDQAPAQKLTKHRLDQLLVDQGLCESRSKAQSLILAGKVLVNGKVVDKPGTLFKALELNIKLTEQPRYVSRGGYKLEKALHTFNISVQDRFCMDIGASTGGFTDCLLQHGARQILAVDTGYGQLDWKLRSDERVTLLEKTNARNLTLAQWPASLQQAPVQQEEKHYLLPSCIVIDVSFISVQKVLPQVSQLLDPTQPGDIVVLIKPQFEYLDFFPKEQDSTQGRPAFDGIVRGAALQSTILEGVLKGIESQCPHLKLQHLDYSPIQGPEGNIEYLAHFEQNPSDQLEPILFNIPDLVARAQQGVTKTPH